MVQPLIYDRNQGIREAITGIGSTLGDVLQKRGARQKEQEYGNTLQGVMQQLGPQATGLEIASLASSRGIPMDYLQKTASVQKDFRDTTAKTGFGIEKRDDLVSLFERFGMPTEQAGREADLYTALTPGGKTSYANNFMDRMQRGSLGGDNAYNAGVNIAGGPSQDVSDVEQVEVQGFQFPEVNLFKGLTPKEKIGREKDLFNANAKNYAEIQNKSRGYDDELRRLHNMEKLNESGKLPTGLERLNIKWETGDIRFPALANPETQLFVKSVNDFTTKAKDTYGARISNFELETFMRRLPTLANTEEGRRLILNQMKVHASLEKLYEDSLKEVYDNYGLRGIDSQKAEKIAKDLRDKDEKALLRANDEILNSQEILENQNIPTLKGHATMKTPGGSIIQVPDDKILEAKEHGATLLNGR